MPFTFLIASFAIADARSYFDKCEAQLRKLASYSVHLESRGVKGTQRDFTQFDFSISGSSVLLRVREPGTQLMAASDRFFQLKAGQLTAYDRNTNEVIRRKLQDKDSYIQRYQALLGKLDPALLSVMDPNLLRSFFAPYRALKDWSATRSNGLVSVGRSAKGTGQIFRFDASSGLLKEVWFSEKGASADWKFTIRSGGQVALAVPTDAKRVSSFYVREAPPVYRSREAKAAVEAMLKRYGNFSAGKIDIDSDGSESTIYLNGRRVREDTRSFSWSYDDGILTVLNHATGRVNQGKATRPILAEYLSKLGADVDPLIMRILARRTPYQELFPAQAVVSMAGSAGSGDRLADIITVKASTVRLSMFINHTSHLLDSLESETSDLNGRTLTRTFRRFAYSQLENGPGHHLFHIETHGANPSPLPSVEVSPGH